MHNNCHSSLRPIQAAVPHGSIPGQTLFNMYINDMPTVENDSNIAMSVYADDTNISVRPGSVDIAVRKLNSVIGLLEPWFRKWRIKINTKKFTITLFSKRLRHFRRSTHQVKIFNENRVWTKETKYLGATLDPKLTFRTHISCILRKANYRLRQLFPLLNKSSAIDINLALVIYTSLLRSILSHACPPMGLCCQHLHK
jgi:hypothetical protein